MQCILQSCTSAFQDNVFAVHHKQPTNCFVNNIKENNANSHKHSAPQYSVSQC